MKIQKLVTTALLAIAGLGPLVSSARAATLSYEKGDLLLGFYVTGGEGLTKDYVVNLGQASSYRDGTLTGPLAISGIKADLDLAFGTDWITRDDLFWGVFGTTSTSTNASGLMTDPAGTNYATKPREDVNTANLSGGFSRGSQALQLGGPNSGATAISKTGSGYRNELNSTANNSRGVIQQLPLQDSFASKITNNGVTAMGSFDYALGNFGAGTAGTALDLFRMAPAGGSTGVALSTPGDYVGTFTINNAGILSYNVAAVPEPGTFLLIGAAAAFLLVIRRRRSAAISE